MGTPNHRLCEKKAKTQKSFALYFEFIQKLRNTKLLECYNMLMFSNEPFPIFLMHTMIQWEILEIKFTYLSIFAPYY